MARAKKKFEKIFQNPLTAGHKPSIITSASFSPFTTSVGLGWPPNSQVYLFLWIKSPLSARQLTTRSSSSRSLAKVLIDG
jgi:hypothetical protein